MIKCSLLPSLYRGGEGREKPPEQRPLLEGDMMQPPEADLSHIQANSLSSAASVEMTEGHHTLPPDISDLVDHNSGGRSGSVSFLSHSHPG
jgi:hypothetical protein